MSITSSSSLVNAILVIARAKPLACWIVALGSMDSRGPDRRGLLVGGNFAQQQGRLAVQADFDDVRPKQEGKCPVDHDAQPSAPTGHLKQVISAPHEPRQHAAHTKL